MDYNKEIERIYNFERMYLSALSHVFVSIVLENDGILSILENVPDGDKILAKRSKETIDEFMNEVVTAATGLKMAYKEILEKSNKAEKYARKLIKKLGMSVESSITVGENINIEAIKTNIKTIDKFLGFAEVMSKVAKYGEELSKNNGPSKIWFLKTVKYINNDIVRDLNRHFISQGDFMKTLSMMVEQIKEITNQAERIRKILESEQNLKKEYNTCKPAKVEKPQFEILNKENEKINAELEALVSMGMFLDEVEGIVDFKSSFDRAANPPFNESTVIETAQEAFVEVNEQIKMVKQKIAAYLAYLGEDIEDVLRDKQPYLVRDYVEKLKFMSDKYGKMMSELDIENIDVNKLAELAAKAQTMYGVVDEMRENAYVVDAARFSK